MPMVLPEISVNALSYFSAPPQYLLSWSRAISRNLWVNATNHSDHVVGHGVHVRTRSVCYREVGRHDFRYGDQLIDARAGAVNPLELASRQEGFSRGPSHKHIGIYNRIRLIGVGIGWHKFHVGECVRQFADKVFTGVQCSDDYLHVVTFHLTAP